MVTKTYIGQWVDVLPSTLPSGEGREILVSTVGRSVRQIHSHTLIGMIESCLVSGEDYPYAYWSETPQAPIQAVKVPSYHDRSRFYDMSYIEGGLNEYPAN